MRKRLAARTAGAVLVCAVALVSRPYRGLGAAGDISTVAGLSALGDNSPATDAALFAPNGLAFDSSGNMIIADTGHHRVRKISALTGTITTIAGNGYGGYSGDNGPGTSAKLNTPTSVAIDANDNVYVADSGNHRIRRIAPDGTIITVAGTGTAGYNSDGISATSALLYEPQAVAIDSNNDLYIADLNNHRIRKVTKSTGIISTVAGQAGSGGFSGDGAQATSATLQFPYGIALDASDNLYIADTANNRIRKVTAATGVISTVAGNGTLGFEGDGNLATSAKIGFVRGLSVDSAGNIFIADYSNNRIRKVTAATGNISTVAGSSQSGFGGDGNLATLASLSTPYDVKVDSSGNLYIADSENHRIRKVTIATSNISTVAGVGLSGFAGDGGPATSARLNTPYGVEFDSDGNLYVADADNGRIRKITPSGTITTVAGGGGGSDGVLATVAYIGGPHDVAFDPAGNMYITEAYSHVIRKVDKITGLISTYAGTGLTTPTNDGLDRLATNINNPMSLAFDASGNLYYSEYSGHKVRKISSTTGLVTTVAGTGTSGAGTDGVAGSASKLAFPASIEFDSHGDLFIADVYNHSIRKVNMTTGVITTIAGDGNYSYSGDGGQAVNATLGAPTGLAFDAADNLYITEAFNSVIRRIDRAAGTISTLSGTRTVGFSGDGGPAALAQISRPIDLVVDAAGNIFIADTFNHRIRKIALAASAVTTTLAPTTTGAATTTTAVTPPTVPRKGGLSAKYLAAYLSMTLPQGSTASISVSSAAKKICAVKKGKLVSLKTGTCRFTVTVKPKKGKTVRKSTSLLAQ